MFSVMDLNRRDAVVSAKREDEVCHVGTEDKVNLWQ